jgi:chromosome segregation ATPase
VVEENQTPGFGSEGRGRESDRLSERRALRAAQEGEGVLLRRAEAAEATVQTLERHVVSLQQRLTEAEQERGRLRELLEAERTVAVEREGELRRVKQREYAEQQLRVEAEERLVGIDREHRADVEELSGRLEASDREAAGLAERLEALRRQLAEAEQAAAAERAAVHRAEDGLQARVAALEALASELEEGLRAERRARESSERLLAAIGAGHRRMELLVGEIKGIVARLTAALVQERPVPVPSIVPPPRTVNPQPTEPAPASARGEEMTQALAAAVERLRARADAAPPPAQLSPPPAHVAHKHSMSLLGRWRLRRKQRRGR